MSTAEVALSLTCACAKNLVEVSRQIREGGKLSKKSRSVYSATVLTGKTFGIVGGGRIGQLVAKKLYVTLILDNSEVLNPQLHSIGAFDGRVIMYVPAAVITSLISHSQVRSIYSH